MKIIERLRKSNGNAAVEFALIMPILFLVLSGIFNFGLIIIQKNQLCSVLSAGLLYAVQGSSNLTNIQATMASATAMSPLTVTTTQFCGCADGSTVSCLSFCSGGVTPASYITLTASSQVTLYALDFILTNPYPISDSITLRTG